MPLALILWPIWPLIAWEVALSALDGRNWLPSSPPSCHDAPEG